MFFLISYTIFLRGNQSVEEHAQVIAMLINHIPEGESHNAFISYVVGTCFVKINRRLTNKQYAKPLFDCIITTKVPSDSVLNEFTLPTEGLNKNDWAFLRGVSNIEKLYALKLPQLSKLNINSTSAEVIQAYNHELSNELQQVMDTLLTRLHENLGKLCELSKKEGNKWSWMKWGNRFRTRMESIVSDGAILRRLAFSQLLHGHFQAIGSLLASKYGVQPTAATYENNQRNEMDEENEEDKEDNDDLLEVQPLTLTSSHPPLAVWRSCLKWVRLVVSHFEACRILGESKKQLLKEASDSVSPIISIRVLTTPHQSKETMPWKMLVSELFEPEKAISIIRMIEHLAEGNSRVYEPFKTVGGKYSSESKFTGTMHCEACLASLMVNSSGGLARGLIKDLDVSYFLSFIFVKIYMSYRLSNLLLGCRNVVAPFVPDCF